jgi:arabinose-5-phosphate isomerase
LIKIIMANENQNKKDSLSVAKDVIATEIESLKIVEKQLDENFEKAVNLILDIHGRLIIAGIGKSGSVGRKIAATMASTGTPAYFLHPAEGFHGDLGLILPGDIVMLISNSGETEEIINLLPSLKKIGPKLISITATRECTLARKCDISITTGIVREADPMNLVPTSSTIAAMALGDALSVALLIRRGFAEGDFAQFHPGGSLGRKLLLSLADLAFEGDDAPVVQEDSLFKEAHYVLMKKHLGAVCVVDKSGKLTGLVTDGDVRRLLESKKEMTICQIMELPVKEVMTPNPKRMNRDTLAVEGLAFMHGRMISQLPIVDDNDVLTGLVRILDLIRAGLGEK